MTLETVTFVLLATSAVLDAAQITVKPKYDLDNAKEYFNEFLIKHNKVYEGESYNDRYNIFVDNLKRINRLNAESTAVYDIDKHADLSQEEFKDRYTCVWSGLDSAGECQSVTSNTADAPDSWDWRQQGGVTPVKNQQQCGSCWAFSAVGVVESQVLIKQKKTVSLSVQQILDCDTADAACMGGFTDAAFTYVMHAGGLESNSDYPYLGRNGTSCTFDASKVVSKVDSCTTYVITAEDDLRGILHSQGPLSISIDASQLNGYNSGILDYLPCNQNNIDHAVILVGYGTENGAPYWLVKNSWGTDWGEQGYFKTVRGKNAICITNVVVSATIV